MPYQLHLLDILFGSESAGLDAVVLFNYYEEQDHLRTGKSSIPCVQMQLCIYCTGKLNSCAPLSCLSKEMYLHR